MKTVGLAPGDVTGIGSLPFDDVSDAIGLVLDATPMLPAAPSLPGRLPAEYLLARAAAGLRGVEVTGDGSLDVDPGAVDPTDPVLDPLPASAHQTTFAFLDAVADRTRPIKLQVCGPVTLGVALLRAGVEPGRAFAAAGVAVRARADALVAEAQRRAPAAPLYVFVDEPGLVAVADSGFHLGPDETIDVISSVLAVLEPHAVTGLHCCGVTDWRLAQHTGAQILSLPVDVASRGAAGTFAGHIERGGWVAWGAIRTDGPVSGGADVPWRRLGEHWCELVRAGCDPVLLRERALITPACGLAHHTPAQAAHLLGLAADLGRRIQTQSLGLRLTVGA